MVSLAAIGSDDRLDTVGPSPPGLECRSPDRLALEVHHVDPALVEGTRLIGRVEGLLHALCHHGLLEPRHRGQQGSPPCLPRSRRPVSAAAPILGPASIEPFPGAYATRG